jgi:hypothetical protein
VLPVAPVSVQGVESVLVNSQVASEKRFIYMLPQNVNWLHQINADFALYHCGTTLALSPRSLTQKLIAIIFVATTSYNACHEEYQREGLFLLSLDDEIAQYKHFLTINLVFDAPRWTM